MMNELIGLQLLVVLHYIVEPLYCGQHWNKCKYPDYRGVLDSGVNLYYKVQFGTFVSVFNTGVSSIEGLQCIHTQYSSSNDAYIQGCGNSEPTAGHFGLFWPIFNTLVLLLIYFVFSFNLPDIH